MPYVYSTVHRHRRRLRCRSRAAREHSGYRADFDEVYDTFKTQVVLQNQFQLVPLIAVAIRMVEIVSKKSGDRGVMKRELVLALLTRLIQDSQLSLTEQTSVLLLLESLGPSIIDFGIDAAKGNLLPIPAAWRRYLCCEQ